MINIIDYGMGNCGSIKNMLRHLGVESEIISKPEALNDSTGIILPGVGSFDNGVRHMEPFKEMLHQKVLKEGIPFLGVCLGMQLLLERSEEGCLSGLGWINGAVKRFDFSGVEKSQRLPVPHMGWAEVYSEADCDLLSPAEPNRVNRFYFVHSFHAIDVPSANELATCTYGYKFTCAVRKQNIFGVQFHPEKSHKFGKVVLRKFVEISGC